MNIRITPAPLKGTVKIPPSKSAAHRALICAALAAGESNISPVYPTEDLSATTRGCAALGAQISPDGLSLKVRGIVPGAAPPSPVEIDCGESGSTLRFLLPIAAAMGVPARFLGKGQLPYRPMEPLLTALQKQGITCKTTQGMPEISGKLSAGVFSLPGNISSQYISGLLFALPLLAEGSEIRLTSPLESGSYVELTLSALAACGVRVQPMEYGWRIPGKQAYRPGAFAIEGDYSSAAFWLCAGALAGPVYASGLLELSLQGDRAILPLLKGFGAQAWWENECAITQRRALSGMEIDASQIPDLVPVLAALAACSNGKTLIYGAERLRIKESDRLHAISVGLRQLGAMVAEFPDRLIITGQEELAGGKADACGDHRIAMALSIAAIRCKNPVVIAGAECVAKSYPTFWEDYQTLGGIIHGL